MTMHKERVDGGAGITSVTQSRAPRRGVRNGGVMGRASQPATRGPQSPLSTVLQGQHPGTLNARFVLPRIIIYKLEELRGVKRR